MLLISNNSKYEFKAQHNTKETALTEIFKAGRLVTKSKVLLLASVA